jgi:hypothetical protein
MIVSIHVPKTAGISFQALLKDEFGERVLFDYGDWVGLETRGMRDYKKSRALEMRARRDELLRDYDVIYGHFEADKYLDLFPVTDFSAFFRHPYQQIISLYNFLARGRPNDETNYLHAGVKLFHTVKPTLLEFVEILPNIQSNFMGKLKADDLAVVGLMEQYDRSVLLFSKVFGRTLRSGVEKLNVDPNRNQSIYDVDPVVRVAIDKYCAEDMELYRCASERFSALAKKYDI